MNININGKNVDINISGEENGTYQVEVFNVALNTVYKETWINNGNFDKTITVQELASGTYFVVLTTPAGFELREKFIIVE
jgi:hypothetical protein